MFIHFDIINKNVADRHTDGLRVRQTSHDGIGCACIASRGKATAFYNYYKKVNTCKLRYSAEDDVLDSSSILVITTVRLMSGSATEDRLLPYIITFVPPLDIDNYISIRNIFNVSRITNVIARSTDYVQKICDLKYSQLISTSKT